MKILDFFTGEELLGKSIIKITKAMDNYRNYEWEEQEFFEYKYSTAISYPGDFSFGIEIEFRAQNLEKDNILEELCSLGLCINNEVIDSRSEKRDYTRWRLMKETTSDWEIISPVLHDDYESWFEIEQVCNLIRNKFHGYIDDRCSMHVHIGRSGLFNETKTMLGLFEVYDFLETFTNAFSAGDYNKVSEYRIFKYALTLVGANKYFLLGNNIDTIDEGLASILKTANEFEHLATAGPYNNRFVGLNFRTQTTNFSTIEFRTFNGTLNPLTIQTYLLYVANIIRVVNSRKALPKLIEGTCYNKGEKILIKKSYINNCLEFLADDTDIQRQLVSTIVRNKYELSNDVVRALNGKYYQSEVNKVLLRR